MSRLTPPPKSGPLTRDAGMADPAWAQWFHEIWNKSQDGFQALLPQTVNSSEAESFKLTGALAGYKDYKITLDKISLSQPGSILNLQVSTDAGATYKTGAMDYSWSLSLTGATSYKEYNNADTQIQLVSGSLGNKEQHSITGEIIFYDLGGTSPVKYFKWDLRYKDSSDDIVLIRGAGSYNGTDDIDGIRLRPDQGKLTSGELEIFGAK